MNCLVADSDFTGKLLEVCCLVRWVPHILLIVCLQDVEKLEAGQKRAMKLFKSKSVVVTDSIRLVYQKKTWK